MTPADRRLADEFSDLHGAICTVLESLEEELVEWIQITPVWSGFKSMFVYKIREIEGLLEDIRADFLVMNSGTQIPVTQFDPTYRSYDNNVLQGSSYEWKKISSIASDTTEDPYKESRGSVDPTRVTQNGERLHQIFSRFIELSDVFYKQKKSWWIKIAMIKDPDMHDMIQDIYLLFQQIWRKTGELRDILILGEF